MEENKHITKTLSSQSFEVIDPTQTPTSPNTMISIDSVLIDSICEQVADIKTDNSNEIDNSPVVKTTDIFPWVSDYSIDPDTEPTKDDKVNNSLLNFMSQAHGFNPELFKK